MSPHRLRSFPNRDRNKQHTDVLVLLSLFVDRAENMNFVLKVAPEESSCNTDGSLLPLKAQMRSVRCNIPSDLDVMRCFR